MPRCRMMTRSEVLRDAKRRKRAALTKAEQRAVLATHRFQPRVICAGRRRSRNPDVDTAWDEDRADASRGFSPRAYRSRA